MSTQRDWAGVPELTDDAAIISSSFISELPLSQAFPPTQSWKKTKSSSVVTSRDAEYGLAKDYKQEATKRKYSLDYLPQSQTLFSSQGDKENVPRHQVLANRFRDTCEKTAAFRPPYMRAASCGKNVSNPVYQVPTETMFSDYVPPYRTSIGVDSAKNDQRLCEDDSRLAPPGRPKTLSFHNANSSFQTHFPSSNHSDLESDYGSPATEFPPKRLSFQFSQTPKPNVRLNNNTTDILSSHSKRRPERETGNSVGSLTNMENSETIKNDRNFYLSTPVMKTNRGNKLPDSGFFDYRSPADSLNTPASLYLSNVHDKGTAKLRSVEEIPVSYRGVFEFPYFNLVQSLILDDVLYTDQPIVVSAPTGAGKTVIFELAIIRLLAMFGDHKKNWKIVYVAPMKALCSERYLDWKEKFQPHGLNCLELTGDTEMDSITELHKTNLILTTPEKWDSMSRKWKDNRSLFQMITLFLVDEIHILNDNTRGSTIEAVISRMKTLRLANKNSNSGPAMRFIAVSATIPNIEDIATWLGSSTAPASSFNLGEKYRPVKLMKMVVGYPFKEGTSDFRFDMNLAYRLKGIIDTYSDNKPTLVFCSSRKSVEQTADVLKKEHNGRSLLKSQNKEAVQKASHLIREGKIAEMVRFGIGAHHAGLGTSDRKQVEDLFRKGLLPVLVSTSTLAMGVNLPAHLVVIKSTVFYNMGTPTEYTDSQVLQMIGRAGRPQFDTSATAVIMTKFTTKSKYENLVNGTQKIESSLHKHLIEHLNAEVVLHTITDMALAVEWIRHTFLYVRVMKNPAHYGYSLGLDKKQVEKRLEDLCLKNLNELAGLKLITMDPETYSISPTDTGKLMARYCIAFATMKTFHTIESEEGAKEMLDLIVGCSEFDEFIQLRNNEKSTLNALNKNKNKQTIRYPMTGRIKTKQMKTNCLIQAQLSCLPVQDFSLSQDVLKIFRVGQRVAKCLMEFLWQRTDYRSLLTAIELYKGTKTKLWVDSKFVAKQLDGIGPTMSHALVNAGMTSFQKIEETNPRELELIVNRHPPFGNQIRDAIAVLPKYEMSIEQVKNYKSKSSELLVCISLANRETIETKKGSTDHQSVLVIGNQDNNIVFKWRIIDRLILREQIWKRKIDVTRAQAGPELFVHLISQEYVGLDIHTTYVPVYQWSSDHMQLTNNGPNNGIPLGARTLKQPDRVSTPGHGRQLGQATKQLGQCQHKCLNKTSCGHKCCKDGVDLSRGRTQRQNQSTGMTSKSHDRRGIEAQIRTLKNKANTLDVQPGVVKRQRMTDFKPGMGLQQYAYQKPPSMRLSSQPPQYQFQQRAVPKSPQSALRNMPVFRYGVGGRRINPQPNQDPAMPGLELDADEFDEAYKDEFEDEFENSYDQQGFVDNVDNQQQVVMRHPTYNTDSCQKSEDQMNPHQVVGTSLSGQDGRNRYSPNMESFGDVDNDNVFESDDSLDNVIIQEVSSTDQSRHQSPQHFSQDTWAELHMYQQDREAAFDKETYDPLDRNSSNNPAQDEMYRQRQGNEIEIIMKDHDSRWPNVSTMRGQHVSYDQMRTPAHQHRQLFSNNGIGSLSCHGNTTSATMDFLESNSSDDELCHAEEILSHGSHAHPSDIEMLTECEVEYNQQSGRIGIPYDQETKWCTHRSLQHKGHTTPGSKASCYKSCKENFRSPKHRYGQVVAWVADSDSSPLSQKSNPKCKTPIMFKKSTPKLNLHQMSTPNTDTWIDNSDEISPCPLEQFSDKTSLTGEAGSGHLPRTSTFFHVLRASKNEDIAEVSGNIFAGVF